MAGCGVQGTAGPLTKWIEFLFPLRRASTPPPSLPFLLTLIVVPSTSPTAFSDGPGIQRPRVTFALPIDVQRNSLIEISSSKSTVFLATRGSRIFSSSIARARRELERRRGVEVRVRPFNFSQLGAMANEVFAVKCGRYDLRSNEQESLRQNLFLSTLRTIEPPNSTTLVEQLQFFPVERLLSRDNTPRIRNRGPACYQ